MLLNDKTFREEIKFKIFAEDFPKIYGWIGCNKFDLTYPARKVNSIYLDTLNYYFAYSNITGKSKRMKVRGRWYGDIFDRCGRAIEDIEKLKVNFEIKRKLNISSDKLTFPATFNPQKKVNLPTFSKWMETNCKKTLQHVPFFHSYALHSSTCVSYNRKYYECSFVEGLRLTIDNDIRYSRPSNTARSVLLSTDYIICELKYPVSIRPEVVSALATFPGRRVRFSKYLSAITKQKLVSY